MFKKSLIRRRDFIRSGTFSLLFGPAATYANIHPKKPLGSKTQERSSFPKSGNQLAAPELPHDEADRLIGLHPASETLAALFPKATLAKTSDLGTNGKSKYIPLITSVVGYFAKHQNEKGAIIDPYQNREVQYATPAFAAAAGFLVAECGQSDLLQKACSALTWSIRALANGTTADDHADFYTSLVVHARRWLNDSATAAQREEWTRLLSGLVPLDTYMETTGTMNWNLVNVAGECLRRKDGLVAPELGDDQTAYIERSMGRQQKNLTPFGLYKDPNSPLAYDIFTRIWMENAFADGAYHGPQFERWEDFFTLGGLSTLLLISPTGEWPSGGRSAHHQWNEAAAAAVCEFNAVRWKTLGRPDIAGAFKRGAHLCLDSMYRWVRPTGEMWIIKNRADPKLRHAYEQYSFHSQYNLLPMVMLALAWMRADDTIAETPLCSEAGSYVFDLRKTFHKICAAGAGTYALVETSPDPHYNSTGLLRMHRVGFVSPAYSDNVCPEPAYNIRAKFLNDPITPGISWSSDRNASEYATWFSAADHIGIQYGIRPEDPVVSSTDLTNIQVGAGETRFTVTYRLAGSDSGKLSEVYALNSAGLDVVSTIVSPLVASTRVIFPVLVSDGFTDTEPVVSGAKVIVKLRDCVTAWELVAPEGVILRQEGGRSATHNGWMQAVVGEFPEGVHTAHWRLTCSAPAQLHGV